MGINKKTLLLNNKTNTYQIMKKPLEILMQNLKFRIAEIDESLMPKILSSMDEYANHVLDQAKVNVSLRETNVYTTPDIDTGFSQGIEAAMETIELTKQK